MGKFDLLSERFHWAIERKLRAEPSLQKITQRSLAQVAGLSPSAVGYWFADKNGIDAEPARKVGAFLGVNPVWLEKGEGDPELFSSSQFTPSQFNAGEPHELKQGRYVAIVGVGRGGPEGFLNIDDYAPGDGDGLIYTYSADPGAYGIRVRGDSMRPRIKSGEYIVAEPNIEAQPGDDVVVKRTDGRAMVKELLWIRDDEACFGSVNNGVPPITLPLTDIEKIHRVAAIVPRGSALLKPNK